MKRAIVFVLILACCMMILVGCNAHQDKADLVRWLHSIDKENTEVYLWNSDCESDGAECSLPLKEDEVECLTGIFADLSSADITLNKDLIDDTLDYGLLLVVDGVKCCISGADTPYGSSEICFREKQWWIDQHELRDFMCDLMARHQ